MSDTDDLLDALLPVTSALQRLGVPFYVGGSVASTFHRAIRSTLDLGHMRRMAESLGVGDLLAALRPGTGPCRGESSMFICMVMARRSIL